MSYMTDETMDEIAQFNLDTMWESPEAIDSDVIRPGDIADCVHSDATVTEYADKSGVYFTVWECGDCGRVGSIGMEY